MSRDWAALLPTTLRDPCRPAACAILSRHSMSVAIVFDNSQCASNSLSDASKSPRDSSRSIPTSLRPDFPPQLSAPLSPNQGTPLANNTSQAISRRVPTSSRPDVLSATPLTRTVATRSVPPFTVSSAESLVPSMVTPTPTPTSKRVLSGTTRPSSTILRTPRSTFLVPRWPLVVSRRQRTATISLRKFT